MAFRKKARLPTDSGGIVEVTVTGADGNRYTWMGTGKVSRTITHQQHPITQKMNDVEYIEILIVPDPSKHNAKLPVVPAQGDSSAD